MKSIKEWFKRLRTPCEFDIVLGQYNKHFNLGMTLYSHDLKVGDFLKRQKRIHKWFKHITFLPLLRIFNRLFGRHLSKSVPDYIWNKNVLLFDHAFERSIHDWHRLFRTSITSPDRYFDTNLRLDSDSNVTILRSLKRIYETVILNDSAYFEFHNILMFNLARYMNLNHSLSVDHVFYTSKRIDDVSYFMPVCDPDGILLKRLYDHSTGDIRYVVPPSGSNISFNIVHPPIITPESSFSPDNPDGSDVSSPPVKKSVVTSKPKK